MKAKLGISLGLLGALSCLAVYFGGYTSAIVLLGYVFLFEESEWLKKTVVKAVALSVCFDVLLALIGLIPSLLDWIRQFVVLFDGEFNYSVISRIFSIITSALRIVETCFFLGLGFKALSVGTIKIPFVDKLIDKHM